MEDMMIVKDNYTALTCQILRERNLETYDDNKNARLNKSCLCYHANGNADSTVQEMCNSQQTFLATSNAKETLSRRLNYSCQICNNNKPLTLHPTTGMDDFCYHNVDVHSRISKKLSMDASLAGCVSMAMCRSPRFCKGFLKYAVHHGLTTHPRPKCCTTHDGAVTEIPFLLEIRLGHEIPEWIDFKW